MTISEPEETTGEHWILSEVGFAISVEGSLNPRIFHPQWFVREGLLRAKEAEDAKIELAADDYSLFRTRDFTTEVTRDSLIMVTQNQAFEDPLRDLFMNVFRLLRHTPLTEMSISRTTHWRVNPLTANDGPSANWDRLLPLAQWDALLDGLAPTGVAVNGLTPTGIKSVVSVEPSNEEDALIFVGCRYEWDLAEDAAGDDLLRILKDEWGNAHDHAEQATRWILGLLKP